VSGVLRRLRRQADRLKDAIREAEAAEVRNAPPRWTPKADNLPQQRAVESPADHLFFGGSAGTGKSSTLVGLALTRHRKSLLLRRQATQLPEISQFLRDCLRAGDKFAQVGHGARAVTSDGRRVELSGCDNPAMAQRWKGRAHDLKGYDELTDFNETVFRFINIWNRSTVPGQHCQVVGASNPPTTAEGEWVIQYWGPWIDPQSPVKMLPGELGWFVRDPETDKDRLVDGGQPITLKRGTTDVLLTPKSRTFIPGVMVSDLEQTGYRAALEAMPEELQAAYLHGNFKAQKKDHQFQLIPTEWVRQAVQRGRQQAWRRQTGRHGFPHPPLQPLTALGVDPAGGGSDECSLAPAYGRDVGPIWSYRGKETAEGQLLGAKVLSATEQNPEAVVRIDVGGGYGLEAANLLSSGSIRLRTVDRVSFGASTTYRDRSGRFNFQDMRSAMWWYTRELLDPAGKADHELVTLPDDPRLVADLCAPRWRLMHGSVIQVEPKVSRQGVDSTGASQWGIKERLGRSTDRGDAAVMSLWKGESVVLFAAPATKPK
jgi:hypothetical protein